jgi:hypothetical protein
MSNLLDDLTRLLGRNNVSVDTIDRLAYSHDAFPLALKQAVPDQPFSLPDVVVFPDNAEQISALFRVAQAHRVPVIPYGDGSGIVGGALPVRGVESRLFGDFHFDSFRFRLFIHGHMYSQNSVLKLRASFFGPGSLW